MSIHSEYTALRNQFPDAKARIELLQHLVHVKVQEPSRLQLVEIPSKVQEFFSKHKNALV